MTEFIRLFRGPFGHVSLLNVGGNLVTHAHPEIHIVIWLAGCAGTMTVDGWTIAPRPGIAIGINSFEPHSHTFARSETPGQFLAFYIDREWLNSRLGLPPASVAFEKPVIPLPRWLVDLAFLLPDRLASGEEELVSYEVVRFIDHVMAAAGATQPKKAGAKTMRRSRDFRIRKAVALMEANIGERICFDEVARSVGLSRPHFFVLFREQMGVTPNVYWNTLRLAEATRCLQSSDEPVISLACNLGFSSQGNFSRFFREHTGVPPTVYRSAASEGRPGLPTRGRAEFLR
ncbi:AraC family transcriptional regulator [Chelativorans sp. M5D2P16]|uniref:AraC family transcriptional regulator n=1 Tax=Chelativorans sp. M5D2P16 TaxID=3095678 RepID=UPI002ACAF689|nr:AraC family transcriptional regulator [Chelativorans sp. M5D2P16]MDZ5699803.1 AraC family transcriptional regulator [Chelativorans sp. M5D2P16]